MKFFHFVITSFFIFTFIFLSLLTACSPVDSLQVFNQQQVEILLKSNIPSNPARQRISLVLPSNKPWQEIDVSLYKTGTPVILIPKDERFSNWHESIRTDIRSYKKYPDITPTQLAQQVMKTAYEKCTKINSDIIEHTANIVIYRLEKSHCKSENNQIQFGKAFKGIDAVYTVYYSAVPQYVSQDEIARMQAVIENARLVNNPTYKSNR